MRGSIAPMGAVRNTGQSSSAIPWVPPGVPTTDFIPSPANSPGVGLSLISNGISMGLTNARPALVGSSTTGEVPPNGSAWAGTPDSELRPFVVMGVNSLDGWMSFANSNLGTDPGGHWKKNYKLAVPDCQQHESTRQLLFIPLELTFRSHQEAVSVIKKFPWLTKPSSTQVCGIVSFPICTTILHCQG